MKVIFFFIYVSSESPPYDTIGKQREWIFQGIVWPMIFEALNQTNERQKEQSMS